MPNEPVHYDEGAGINGVIGSAGRRMTMVLTLVGGAESVVRWQE